MAPKSHVDREIGHKKRYRIDHEGMVPEMYVGVLAFALWWLKSGPTIENIGDGIERSLALAIIGGALVAILGTVTGTRFFFRACRRRWSYTIQLIGLPFIITSLGWITYATPRPESLLLSSMAGGLGLCIEIGFVRLAVRFVQDLAYGDIRSRSDDDRGKR